MASYFSAKLPVLYVNPIPAWHPKDRNFSVAEMLSAYGPRPMRQVSSQLFVYTPKRLPLGRIGPIATLNKQLFARGTTACLTALGFKNSLICVSFFDGCLEQLNHLRGCPVLYYCIDRFIQPEETELTRRAQVVLAVNRLIAEEKRRLNPHTYWLPTGVDVLSYGGATAQIEPDDMARIPHPRAGLTATFTHYVDYELLLYLARTRSEVSFVLIGPVFRGPSGPDERDRALIGELKSHGNIHWLGMKRTNELPSYVKAFDAGIIPFKDRDFNRGRDPLKLYQYLAAGIPVVSTPLSTFGSEPPGVSFAGTKEKFLAALDHALREAPNEALKIQIAEFVRSANWSNRFKVMEQVLQDVFENAPEPSNPLT
ncbi:MAG TPA: glycosyltransferase [Candidatus Sulfotelmatobacter sp.]|nr:glycosyltransferase [Candidatus Sulfotelmatobacter sp.]